MGPSVFRLLTDNDPPLQMAKEGQPQDSRGGEEIFAVRIMAVDFRLCILRISNRESIIGCGSMVHFRLSPCFIRATYTYIYAVPVQFF